MLKIKWKALVLLLLAVSTSLILIVTASIRTPVIAAETDAEQVSTEQIKVSSVKELKDVQPTDWVFQSIESLVERYKMTLAYPDRTFRGNLAIRRGQLAQWFQGFVNSVESHIEIATSPLATKEDLVALQQSLKSLQQSVQALRQSNPSPRQRI